jgi:hypothetical protein
VAAGLLIGDALVLVAGALLGSYACTTWLLV